jgi:K(+)-stimulated pyrophosphate-energized sodium pump
MSLWLYLAIGAGLLAVRIARRQRPDAGDRRGHPGRGPGLSARQYTTIAIVGVVILVAVYLLIGPMPRSAS